MSNIKYDIKGSLYMNYMKILENKISIVCNKIGFDDSHITWFIFDADERKRESKNIMDSLRIGYTGKDYGFSYINKNEIWISTLSIRKDKNSVQFNMIGNLPKLPLKKENDFLASVIIDEITHIQTGCDHGSYEYDIKLQENTEIYYFSPIERILANVNTLPLTNNYFKI